MLKELIKIANALDAKGLAKEADRLDIIIRKLAEAPEEDAGEDDDIMQDPMYWNKEYDEPWGECEPRPGDSDSMVSWRRSEHCLKHNREQEDLVAWHETHNHE